MTDPNITVSYDLIERTIQALENAQAQLAGAVSHRITAENVADLYEDVTRCYDDLCALIAEQTEELDA